MAKTVLIMGWTNYLVGVITSISATAIWKIVASTTSYVPARYPDVRGKWRGVYVENGIEVVEQVHIKRQFGRRISGTFRSPRDNGQQMTYKFVGRFVYRGHCMVEFWPTGDTYTDHGVGMFQIDNAGTEMTGGSVSFNFESGDLEPRSYSLTRLHENQP